MASEMLALVSELLPAFANASTVSKEMPDDFVATIMSCDVYIPDVLKEMTRAVNALLVCRPEDTTGATEHGSSARKMREEAVIRAMWEELVRMRRRFEPNDLKAITDPTVSKQTHNMWSDIWLNKTSPMSNRKT